MTTIKVGIPNTENATVEVDTDKLPSNVMARLIEMAVTSNVRSAVVSAFANEKAKAERDHDEAEAAKVKADKKYKAVPFDKEAFTTALDAETLATEKVAALYDGKITAARGMGGQNKALNAMVMSNVISALKAKGKKHKEAQAMVGDDPFAFIEKSARKRAGDDADAYKVEIAKLNALYVDPARAILGVTSEAPKEGEEGEADDLI